MQETLNIDINLIKRYAESKRRKELFAFAIWCHIQHVNAVVYNITSSKLRKELSIGKAKAERLISDAAEDVLFEVDGTTFRAGSFRDKTVKFTRRSRKYKSALVKTLHFNQDHKYSLKELYELINEILVIFPITAQEEKDCLQQRGGLYNRCVQKSSDAKSRTLTLKKFCQNVRMSISSCARIIKKLVVAGVIKKLPSILFSAIDVERKEQIIDSLRRAGMSNVSFIHNGLSYIIVPCAYSIANRDVSESYKHKIYNYHIAGKCKSETQSTIPQLCGY